MDTLNAAVLNQFKDLAKISIKENRPMVLVTPTLHSEHYGFANPDDITKDSIRFRTLRGGTVVTAWAPGTYVELLQPFETIASAGKPSAKAAAGGK